MLEFVQCGILVFSHDHDKRGINGSVPFKKIPGIHFILYIVQAGIISVCNNGMAQRFKLLQIIDDLSTKELGIGEEFYRLCLGKAHNQGII